MTTNQTNLAYAVWCFERAVTVQLHAFQCALRTVYIREEQPVRDPPSNGMTET
jgi:hypothetical protein